MITAAKPALAIDGVLARAGTVGQNLPTHRLIEAAITRGEGRLTPGGAFVALTGRHTGRSPQDKFVVLDRASKERIWWGPVNREFGVEQFDRLRARIVAYLQGRDLFVLDASAGADAVHRIAIRIVAERAWHALFAQTMFLPAPRTGEDPPVSFTVLHAPGFHCDPAIDGTRSDVAIAIDLERRQILVAGTEYAGEIKKGIFTVMNDFLPSHGVLPMHCSANAGDGGDVAIFFGLSGTGKTTLSADTSRRLIGDDEHGWSDDGIFNIEGGCYAKVINLSPAAEPEIFATTRRFGTVLENVVVDPDSGELDLADDRYTENTRAAYPIDFIANAEPSRRGGHPSNIILLTADAFGVLPPVARLTAEQAMYHFLSGYTAKVAGTEAGVDEPEATFSACFGSPFLPQPPVVYAQLLGERIGRHQARAWLVNTGWTGGRYGVGHRMPIAATRAIIRAILQGQLDAVPTRRDPGFGFDVPTACPDVPADLLDPRGTWADPEAFDRQAADLARMFAKNFAEFVDSVAEPIRAAGPTNS